MKEDLKEVRKMLEFLVRRERKVDTQTEVATRRLERLEREKDEGEGQEHEANLEEAIADKTKAVKLVVDVPTCEIVFIHASAVVGAEVLTIGTDAWVQAVNDDARAQRGYRARRAWGQDVWKAEKDKEKANKVAQQVRRAAATGSSVRKEDSQPRCAISHPALTSSPGTLRRLSWGQVAHTPRPQ